MLLATSNTAQQTGQGPRTFTVRGTFFALVVAVVTVCNSAQAALVRFKSEAVVSGAVVTMQDIADIQHDDSEWLARVNAVTICPAPATGRSVKVDYETVRSRLASQGINLATIEFSGRSVITVTADDDDRQSPNVPDTVQQRVELQIARAVSKYLAERGPELGHVSVFTQLTADQLAALTTAATSRLDVSGGKPPWNGTQNFTLRFTDRASKPREVAVVCQVAPLARVVAPRRNIPRGTVLQAEDLTWKQLTPDDKADGTYNRLEAVVGQEATASLRAGEPINSKDIRGLPLIRRGDIVTVTSKNRGVTVRMEARAENDGAFGQQIALSSLDRRQKLFARVTAYHEAEVVAAAAEERQSNDASGIRFVSGDK